MVAAHYPLQAMLYSVALHRYLRWRLPGYDPDRHLGGVLYLFVRGMSATEPTLVGSSPVRGLVLVSSGRPGRGAERSLRPRCTPVTTVETGGVGLDRYDVSVAAAASGVCSAFNRAGILDARTSTWRAGWPDLPASAGGRQPRGRLRRPGAASRPRLRRPADHSGDGERRRRHAVRHRRAALARSRGVARRHGPEPTRRGRQARSTSRGRPCTSTGSGSTSAWSRQSSWRAPGPRWSTSI